MVDKEFLALLKPLLTNEAGILYNEPMSRHTTFRIGGPADVFVRPRDVEQLSSILRLAREHAVPYAVIGNGSNLLVSDEGYRGLIVCTSEMRALRVENTCIIAEAGALLSQIARAAYEASLAGFEFAAGIPGTLGGAVFMNAGAYGGEMKGVLQEVSCVDDQAKQFIKTAEELELGYRTSILKTQSGWVAAGAVIALQRGAPEEIRAKMEDFAARRREKQPLEHPSAGSTFKRPEGYFAGKLIEDAGLRGFAIGGAQVSEKHCGFVINRGGATCADVLALLSAVQARVMELFGVLLEPEVRLL